MIRNKWLRIFALVAACICLVCPDLGGACTSRCVYFHAWWAGNANAEYRGVGTADVPTGVIWRKSMYKDPSFGDWGNYFASGENVTVTRYEDGDPECQLSGDYEMDADYSQLQGELGVLTDFKEGACHH